ncbi:MAG TPA: DUF4199 domain-containing protein [Candidatus Acidoferrales bacterium]
MKKTVLIYGLISGVLAVAMMVVTLPFIYAKNLGTADTLGYTSMVLSALLVYFGIRSFRDNAGAGLLTFSKGFVVGVLITLVSTGLYMVAFHLMYFKFVPDFGETFAECMVERARMAGADAQKITETAQQAEKLKQLYDHPASNAAVTFATTFPVGLAMSLVAAAILKRKEDKQQP